MSDSDKSDVDARFAEIIAHWDDADLLGADADPLGGTDSTAPGPASVGELLPGSTVAPPGSPASPSGPVVERPAADPPSASPSSLPSGPRPAAPTPAAPPPPAAPPSASLPSAPPSAAGWRGQPPSDLEDHFEPPPPAPLPAGDLQFWGILLGLCGGPLLLLYLIAFDRDAGSLWTATAILLTLGGFGLLVARQPRRRPDDGDDGARL